MNPATIFNLLCDLANLVKIFAVEIGSEDIAAAVGPVKYFSKSFTGVSLIAIFVIRFFVILKRIPFSLEEARAKIVGILASPAQKLVSILLAPGSKIANLARAKSLKN